MPLPFAHVRACHASCCLTVSEWERVVVYRAGRGVCVRGVVWHPRACGQLQEASTRVTSPRSFATAPHLPSLMPHVGRP